MLESESSFPGGAGASSPPSPAPPPGSVNPRFQRNLNLKSKNYPMKFLYAKNAISRWFVVGLAGESRVSDLTRLEPVTIGSFESNSGEKPLSLVLKENGEEASEFSKNPWSFVAETVKQDFFSSFQQVKDEMKGCELGEIKPTLLLRFGKILFHGNRSFTAESMIGSSPSRGTLKQMRKSFYSNIPTPYVEYITNDIVPQFDFKFEEKELYQVKLSDNTQPDSTIACKCTIELKQVRNLVADMSCLDKNLDLRLMLCTKRISVALTDEENIKSLIDSARIDSEVKGGLRWPLGKQSSGDRYTVVGVWHTNSKTFTNSSMRLKIRHADRFDFITSSGEVAEEEPTENTDLAFEMLKENLELIWKHFLVSGTFS
ncbi:hypothetical protein PHJA_001154100 [Phtheirospermum japonicum]|uniref:DUF7903 domain-containing protein n=1 Tax=Phtheirospermum japonicum TaxID=374723 RepID=A0A830C1T7_9LAMI|nr:hypothetical protein PHJA_001154100 [Phtheirospermum japonicum]